MKLNNRKIAVIGAGVAGLAVARALALRGARPIVLEQARSLENLGAGLQLSPNGLIVIEALGLSPRVRDIGLRLGDVTLRDAEQGRRVLRMDLSKARGLVWQAVPRAALIDVMRQGVERVGAEIRLSAHVAAIDTRPEKTILSLSDGSRIEASIVIAADGLHSVGRTVLNSGMAPFFTGQVAWRAVIDETDSADPSAQVFMAPGRHLVSYPLAGGKRNIVAVEERIDWAEESWSAPGDPDDLRAAFAGFGGPVPGWLEQVAECHLWGLFRHQIATWWYGGSLVLAGDAAHPTLPFLAQGANLALEDAWVLAEALGDAPGVSAAFETYQERRSKRVHRTIEAANANARNYHLRNPVARTAAYSGLRVLDRIAPGLMLRRFDWLYRHDVTASGTAGVSHAAVALPSPLEPAGELPPSAPTPRPKVSTPMPKSLKKHQSRISVSKLRVKPSVPPLLLTETVPEPPKKAGTNTKPTAKPKAKKPAAKSGARAAPKATDGVQKTKTAAPKPSAVTAAVMKKRKPPAKS